MDFVKKYVSVWKTKYKVLISKTAKVLYDCNMSNAGRVLLEIN